MDATTFPIPITSHIIFCAIACVFFIIQYVRTKKSYQLLVAIGIPASLFIYICPENSSLFYAVGAFEAVLLIGAVVFAFIERSRRRQEIEDTTPLDEEVTASCQMPENSDSNSDGEQK